MQLQLGSAQLFRQKEPGCSERTDLEYQSFELVLYVRMYNTSTYSTVQVGTEYYFRSLYPKGSLQGTRRAGCPSWRKGGQLKKISRVSISGWRCYLLTCNLSSAWKCSRVSFCKRLQHILLEGGRLICISQSGQLHLRSRRKSRQEKCQKSNEKRDDYVK